MEGFDLTPYVQTELGKLLNRFKITHNDYKSQ
jgi:hypothetical protein